MKQLTILSLFILSMICSLLSCKKDTVLSPATSKVYVTLQVPNISSASIDRWSVTVGIEDVNTNVFSQSSVTQGLTHFVTFVNVTEGSYQIVCGGSIVFQNKTYNVTGTGFVKVVAGQTADVTVYVQ